MDPRLDRLRALEAAYHQAQYRIEGAGIEETEMESDIASIWGEPCILRIGEPVPERLWTLLGTQARHGLILTAYNPRSRRLPARENQQRHRQLEEAVQQAGLRAWSAVNQDPHQRWPDEPGLCIADPSPAWVDAQLRRLDQNAAVRIRRSCAPELIWHPELREFE